MSRMALVCAPGVPERDRHGGDRRISDWITFLQEAGWSVVCYAPNASRTGPVETALRQQGVPVFGNEDMSVYDLIEVAQFELVIAAFWYYSGAVAPATRASSPSTKIVIDSIDLHFLREARGWALRAHHDGAAVGVDAGWIDTLGYELAAYRHADAVLTVSPREAAIVDRILGKDGVGIAIPDSEDEGEDPPGPDHRSGMLFVGNFRHNPNGEGLDWFVREVLPRIPADLAAAHPLTIVGNELEGFWGGRETPPNVRLVGWVPDVDPYQRASRIGVVPLLHGAGTKRKLMQSLLAGAPCVSTSVGVEGFALGEDEGVIVADDPDAFAAAVIRLLVDDELWRALSSTGRQRMVASHGRDAARSRFLLAIEKIVAS